MHCFCLAFQFIFSLPVPGTTVTHGPHKPEGPHAANGRTSAALGQREAKGCGDIQTRLAPWWAAVELRINPLSQVPQ